MQRGVLPALALALASCSLHPLPEPLITNPETLAAELRVPPPSTTFVGQARAEYYSEGKARKGKVEVMIDFPSNVRVDALSFTDDLISVLTVGPDGFVFYDRGASRCVVGPACAAPAASGFPLASRPDALAALLLGKVPLIAGPEKSSVEFSREHGWYVLELSRGDLSETVHVLPDGATVHSVSLSNAKGKLGTVEFEGRMRAGAPESDSKSASGVVPERIRLRSRDPDTDVSIAYREAEFGPRFSGNPFAFQCPDGISVESLSCLEAGGEQGQVPGSGRD